MTETPGPLVAPHLSVLAGRRPLPGWWHAARAPGRLAEARRRLPEVIAMLPPPAGGGEWRLTASTWTATGTAVVRLASADSSAVLRLSAAGSARLLRESAVLAALAALPLPEELRGLMPERLDSGTAGGWAYTLDVTLPGRSMELLVGQAAWARAELQAVEAIEHLHRLSAREVRVDDALLRCWVDDPLAVVARVVGALPGVTPPSRLTRLRDILRSALDGQAVQVGWVHGDFWAGNLLGDPSGRLTGVVDWDLAGVDELSVHDHLHLLIHRRRDVTGKEIGDVVRDLLRAGSWTEGEAALLGRTAWAFPDGPPPDDVLVLMHWLRHVAAVSVQQRTYVNHSVRVWELRNVHRVLRAL